MADTPNAKNGYPTCGGCACFKQGILINGSWCAHENREPKYSPVNADTPACPQRIHIDRYTNKP